MARLPGSLRQTHAGQPASRIFSGKPYICFVYLVDFLLPHAIFRS